MTWYTYLCLISGKSDARPRMGHRYISLVSCGQVLSVMATVLVQPLDIGTHKIAKVAGRRAAQRA